MSFNETVTELYESGFNQTLLNNTDLCTLETCPLVLASVDYVPSLGGNLFYLTFFAILLLLQLAFGYQYRTWSFTGSMFGGLVLEIIGYVARVQMHYNPFESDPFLMYVVIHTFPFPGGPVEKIQRSGVADMTRQHIKVHYPHHHSPLLHHRRHLPLPLSHHSRLRRIFGPLQTPHLHRHLHLLRRLLSCPAGHRRRPGRHRRHRVRAADRHRHHDCRPQLSGRQSDRIHGPVRRLRLGREQEGRRFEEQRAVVADEATGFSRGQVSSFRRR